MKCFKRCNAVLPGAKQRPIDVRMDGAVFGRACAPGRWRSGYEPPGLFQR
jgi:hypothetical protein